MGGLLTLLRSVPLMVESFRFGARQLRERLSVDPRAPTLPRTELDLPLRVVGVGAAAVFAVLALVPLAFSSIEIAVGRAVAALLVVVFAFFFVTVSSRIVGLVGVTANPTSGMTIATLLGTSSIFLLLGWTDDNGKVAALTVGAVVAIAASIAGDTSQDLKTGFLLGATPRRQQIGELVGVLTSAAFVAITVLLLARAYGFGGEELPAPQAMLMRLVIDGVLARSLPWNLVAIGAGIAIVIELCRIPSLPFAVGVYLPVSTMVPVFLGGLLRLGLERRATTDAERLTRRDRGILLGSGLVGGEGLIGVVIAGAAGWAVSRGQTPWSVGYAWAGAAADWLALSLFVALLVFFCRGVARTNSPR
jgi:putative OPT family oligopeptide transporter